MNEMKQWIASVLGLVLATVLSLIDLGEKVPGWGRWAVVGVVVLISALLLPPLKKRLVAAVRHASPEPAAEAREAEQLDGVFLKFDKAGTVDIKKADSGAKDFIRGGTVDELKLRKIRHRGRRT